MCDYMFDLLTRLTSCLTYVPSVCHHAVNSHAKLPRTKKILAIFEENNTSASSDQESSDILDSHLHVVDDYFVNRSYSKHGFDHDRIALSAHVQPGPHSSMRAPEMLAALSRGNEVHFVVLPRQVVAEAAGPFRLT
jgi:hypothetical protein